MPTISQTEYEAVQPKLQQVKRNRQIKNQFSNLRRQGRTVLGACHDLSERFHLSAATIRDIVYK